MRILLVEDQASVRAVLARLLQKWGHSVVSASDGKEAWSKLRMVPIDFLIADWNMPVMSGLELVEKIRQDPQLAFLPILMISGRSNKMDIVEALTTGTHNYLTKPFSPKQLRKKMEQVWSARFDGSVIERQIDRLLKGHRRFAKRTDGPLVVFGEATLSPKALRAVHRRELVKYLMRTTYVISVVNAEHPDLKLGYLIETSTQEFLKKLRRSKFKERIKLAMISTEMGGNSVLLVRLLYINKIPGLTPLLIYNQLAELTLSQRAGLEKLGIEMLERSKLTAERLSELLDVYVVAPLSAAQREAPLSPEGIRRRISQDIETMSELPMLPQVCRRIMELARDPESELKEWSEAIELDPLGRAAVVKRARSSQYGFRGDLKDLQHVVVLLGKSTLKEVIVAEAVKQAFEEIQEKGFDLHDYWVHSVTVGFAARLLSFPLEEEAWTAEQRQEFKRWNIDEKTLSLLKRLKLYRMLAVDPVEHDPFIGGMMHDIGKVAMVNSYPGVYPMIVEELKARKWAVPMLEAERTVVSGLTHTAVGEILGQRWELGGEICKAISDHHTPEEGDTFSLLIGLADFLGGAAAPFPGEAHYPVQEAISSGKTEQLAPFLPDSFFDEVYMEPDDLIELGRALLPLLQRFAEEMRSQQ